MHNNDDCNGFIESGKITKVKGKNSSLIDYGVAETRETKLKQELFAAFAPV